MPNFTGNATHTNYIPPQESSKFKNKMQDIGNMFDPIGLFETIKSPTTFQPNCIDKSLLAKVVNSTWKEKFWQTFKVLNGSNGDITEIKLGVLDLLGFSLPKLSIALIDAIDAADSQAVQTMCCVFCLPIMLLAIVLIPLYFLFEIVKAVLAFTLSAVIAITILPFVQLATNYYKSSILKNIENLLAEELTEEIPQEREEAERKTIYFNTIKLGDKELKYTNREGKHQLTLWANDKIFSKDYTDDELKKSKLITEVMRIA